MIKEINLVQNKIEREIILESLACKENPGIGISFYEKSPSPVCLVTGGIDSTIMFFNAIEQEPVTPVFVDYGQPYVNQERAALIDLGIHFIELETELPKIEGNWQHIFPLRNYWLLRLVGKMTTTKIFFAATKEEMPETGGDKSLKFLSLMSTFLDLKIETMAGSKDANVAAFVQKNSTKNRDILAKTFSCHNEFPGMQSVHCGNCKACVRRYIAFCSAGVLGVFKTDPAESEIAKDYKLKMTKAYKTQDFSLYSKDRIEQYSRFFSWGLA